MKVVALLSWYDEAPGFLAASVAGIARACDHVIAIDGPYAFYPGANDKPHSPLDQHDTIINTARGAGIGVTLDSRGIWASEVAKRDACFELAASLCKPGDYVWVIDADEVITDIPHDLRERLEADKNHVVAPCLYERLDEQYEDPINEYEPASRSYPAVLIRWPDFAGRRPFVEGTHATYRIDTPEQGLTLRGNPAPEYPTAEATLMHDLRVHHRTKHRSAWRRNQQQAYYERRDQLGLEATPAPAHP